MGKSVSTGGLDYGSMITAMQASNAANQQYQLGQQQLDWSKQVYDQNYPYIQQSAEQSLAGQKQALDFAKQQEDFYNSTYKPVETDYTNRAQNWDTPASEQQQAGTAQEAVASQFNQARSAAAQQLESFGVDPTSTRYAALDIGTRTAQAAAEAGAGNQAIQARQLQGMALESGAINTGRGYASAIPTAIGTSSNAGASGAGTLTNFYGQGANAMNGTANFFNAGNSALGTAEQGYKNYYGNTYPAEESNSSGIGAGLGLLGSVLTAPTQGTMLAALAEGGRVPSALPAPAGDGRPAPHYRVPEEMSPSRGAVADDIPARLAAGEFVLPRPVVQWLGEREVYGLISKAQKEREQVERETTAKPSALPALPGPARFLSPGAAQNRAALPA